MEPMELDLFKVCPVCAGEYRLEIERCADCDVPLVDPEQLALRDARELPLSSGLVALRSASIPWALALAADLNRQSIRYRIDRRHAREDGLLTVCVRRQDWKAAQAVDAARERIEAPDEPEREDEAADYKVCPRCDGEYRLDAAICADCGIELVFPGDLSEDWAEELADPEPDPPSLPFAGPLHKLSPSDDLVCICCRHLRSLVVLSGALDDAGIAHCLEALRSKKGAACLYVRPIDGDAAAEIDARLVSEPLVLDDPELRAELTVCPACGASHALGATECRDCGLVVGGTPDVVDRTCARCGAVIGFATPTCPNCGVALPGE
jgi:ribosomal protein L40E